MSFSTVILAAGQGKRMHSSLPKVLHRLADKPLLEHIIRTANSLSENQQTVIIYGHQGEEVKHALNHLTADWVEQTQQLGTGHALLQGLPTFQNTPRVLVLPGDVPLISAATLKAFIAATPSNAVGLLIAIVPDPTGFGRILRDAAGHIQGIIEEKDASPEQRLIQEINTGIYLIPTAQLTLWLPQLKNANAQREYYLTDIISLAASTKTPIYGQCVTQHQEVLGVNDKQQLATVERYYQLQAAERLMQQGVTLRDPARFDLRGELIVGRDTEIDINVIIEGFVRIGSHCHIGANSILRNVVIGDHTEIKPNSIIDGAEIGEHCHIGPFARLRPGVVVAANAHIGNFIEIKNTFVGANTKIHHLGYIGDSDIGANVNIGAGTITCNYDGANKYRTTIGDGAFIGSSSQLVAPVKIGEGAFIGAGSTITRDAPAHQLTLGRTKQCTIENWKRSVKKGI